MMNNLDFAVIGDNIGFLLIGCLATLGLALAGMFIALIIGVLGVRFRSSKNRVVRFVVIAFVEVIRNTPFLVQIFFLFFALPFAGVIINPTLTAIIALGLNGGAYSIEIIRGGVESIPRGQTEAGLALGLDDKKVFRYIVLKPALRAIYPALTSQFILLTLTSAVCSSISAFELTSVAQRIEAETFRTFEIYFSVTILYLFISWMLMSVFVAFAQRAFSYPTK